MAWLNNQFSAEGLALAPSISWVVYFSLRIVKLRLLIFWESIALNLVGDSWMDTLLLLFIRGQLSKCFFDPESIPGITLIDIWFPPMNWPLLLFLIHVFFFCTDVVAILTIELFFHLEGFFICWSLSSNFRSLNVDFLRREFWGEEVTADSLSISFIFKSELLNKKSITKMFCS